MKKLLLILSLFASLSLEAQYVATYGETTASQNEGFYYFMPRTVIKLAVTIEETQYHIGPYAEFATEMLGTTDYIKENKTETVVKSIDIQLGNEPDTESACFIEFDEKGKEPVPNFILDYDGMLIAVGYNTLPECFDIKKNPIVYDNDDQKPELPVSFIEIIEEQEDKNADDEEEVKKAPKKTTKKDMAKMALDKITKIKGAYFDLVSGVNETNYGNTISFMAENLQNIENECISLFKGKTTKVTYKKYFYIKPGNNEGNSNISLGKLDNGETLKVQFETKNTTMGLNPMGDDVINTDQTNKLFYRVPAQTNVTITLGKNVITSKTLTISQFGEMRLIATKNNKILFNPNTGQIISIVK